MHVAWNGAGDDASDEAGEEDDSDIVVVSEAGEMAGGGCCWCKCFGEVSEMAATLAADEGAPGDGGMTVAGTSAGSHYAEQLCFAFTRPPPARLHAKAKKAGG
uniref:Uncharacterized protein n=1 Tax=Anopheles melas TaxID=34690 RepID=A0A182U5D3_9DIPT